MDGSDCFYTVKFYHMEILDYRMNKNEASVRFVPEAEVNPGVLNVSFRKS